MTLDTSSYRGFYLKKASEDKTYETYDQWGIVVKTIPFLLCPNLKKIPSHSWFDEDGDEEFMPSTPRFEAYEIDITFYCICPHGEANERIRSFWQFISAGELSIFDSYTSQGRQKVRYVSYSDKSFKRRKGKEDMVEFTMRFKVNDPVTNITL